MKQVRSALVVAGNTATAGIKKNSPTMSLTFFLHCQKQLSHLHGCEINFNERGGNMSQITLTPGSNRNTPANIITLNNHTFYFSYETCIAYDGPNSREGARIKNRWGPTTGRHFNEMGVKEYPIVDGDEFEKIISNI